MNGCSCSGASVRRSQRPPSLAPGSITVSTSGSISTSTLGSVGSLVSSTGTVYDDAGQAVETVDASGLRTGTVYYADGQVEYAGPLDPTAPLDPSNPANNWYAQADPTQYFLLDPTSGRRQYTTYAYNQIGAPATATITTAAFTMPLVGPALGSTVQVSVASTAGLWPGLTLDIAGAGGFTIQSIDSGTLMTLVVSYHFKCRH